MKFSNPGHNILAVCSTLLIGSSAVGGEIYKWVDGNGRTHYSENKKEAEAASAVALKIKASPPSAPSGSSPTSYSKDQEMPFKPYQAQGPSQQPFRSPVVERPKSLSGGKADETDAGKCNLARDILSGAVRHRNMMPTDANDRQVAESDVRIFCRK